VTGPQARKSRPLPGAAISDQACEPLSIVQVRPSVDESAESFFVNCHAVLVRSTKRTHRHLYFNLPGAERAMHRALARGDRAEMVLVQLVPVQRVPIRGGIDV